MDVNPCRSVAPIQVPQILIAETNSSTVESLVHTIADSQRELDYDVCTSHDSAVLKLFHSPPPYKLIICNVHLAEMHNFLLLRHNRLLQPVVPFVVTIKASETGSSRQALEQGAFDFILTPLEHKQTMRTIRLALWHNRFNTLIALRELAVEKYRQHLDDYPSDRKTDEVFQRALSVIQKTVASVESTFQLLEESILRLSAFATNLEGQARKQALERLDALPK